jgi:hypothetical protein
VEHPADVLAKHVCVVVELAVVDVVVEKTAVEVLVGLVWADVVHVDVEVELVLVAVLPKDTVDVVLGEFTVGVLVELAWVDLDVEVVSCYWHCSSRMSSPL